MNSIEHIFPLKATITWEIIDGSKRMDVFNCVGTRALMTALGEFANGRRMSWGNRDGHLDGMEITTVENVEMMDVKEPIEVTFILLKPNEDENV